MGDSSWYVYMVRCQNGSLYTGITNNLEARIKKHNRGKGSKAVRMLGLPVVLVYSEIAKDKSTALKREIEIKKLSKQEKEKIVEKYSCISYQNMVWYLK